MIPRLEGGVLDLHSDSGPIRHVDRSEGFDDDAFAKVVADGWKAELPWNGGRKDMRVCQTVVQQADKAIPSV